MYGYSEGQVVVWVYTKEVGANGKMATAAYRQILGESLQGTEDESFQPVHNYSSASLLSLGLRTIA